MTSQTSVNGQITDAVTQTNVKVLAEAPAMAMGNLYQATSQALGNAAHNATNTQQQMTETMQAATTQGIMLLYSIDTASTGLATQKVMENGGQATSKATASDKKGTELRAQLKEAVEGVSCELQEQKEDAKSNINNQIEEAIKFALDCNLNSAEAFNQAARAVMEAYTSSIQDISNAQHQSALNLIKLAATVVTLKAMIEAPDQKETYSEILNLINAL